MEPGTAPHRSPETGGCRFRRVSVEVEPELDTDTPPELETRTAVPDCSEPDHLTYVPQLGQNDAIESWEPPQAGHIRVVNDATIPKQLPPRHKSTDKAVESCTKGLHAGAGGAAPYPADPAVPILASCQSTPRAKFTSSREELDSRPIRQSP